MPYKKIKPFLFFVLMMFSLLMLPSCKLDFFKVVSTSYAKEFCSCTFVVKQTKEYCQKVSRQLIPVSSLKIDSEKKEISALGMGYKSIVAYESEKLGCQIKESRAL